MAVDDLHRFEFAHRSSQDTWGAVLAHLRAEPDNAMTFLENPRWVKPIPEVLQPLADAARKGEPAVERLRADFQTLHNNAEVHLRVIPWWNTAYSAANPVGTAFAGLSAHFRQFPHRFWVWHRRELALADQPEARAWIRHWHRLVRRTDGLDGAYWAYLDALRRQPELGEAAEKRWQNEHGETLPWPPEGSPSTLTRYGTPTRRGPSVKRPEPRAIEKRHGRKAPGGFSAAGETARPLPPERPSRTKKPAGEAPAPVALKFPGRESFEKRRVRSVRPGRKQHSGQCGFLDWGAGIAADRMIGIRDMSRRMPFAFLFTQFVAMNLGPPNKLVVAEEASPFAGDVYRFSRV